MKKKNEIKRQESFFKPFSNLSFMKYLLSLLLVGIHVLPNQSIAQSKKYRKIDSLQNILKALPNGTSHVRALNELAWVYRNKDYQNAFNYATRAKELAIQIKDDRGLATSYNRLALIHQNKGEYENALQLYLQALKIEQKLKYLFGISRSLNQIGSVYIHTKKYDLAIINLKKSISLLQKIGKKPNIAIRQFNIAICYERLGDSEKSIKYYLKSLKIYEVSKKSNQIGKCYQGLGRLHLKLKNIVLANKYLQKALKTFQAKNDKTSIAKVYHQIGGVYVKLRDFETAQKFYLKSLKIKNSLNSKQGNHIIWNNLASIYLKQFKPEKAKKLLDQSYTLTVEKKDSFALALVNTNLGLYHKQKKNYPLAVNYLKKGLDYFERKKEKNHREKVLEYLSEIYALMGQYDQSFAYFSRYNWARDSLEANFRAAMNIKDQYEAEKKKRELAEKDKKIKDTELARLQEYSSRQSLGNWFLGIGFLLSLMIVFAIVRNQQERRKVRKKQDHIDHLLKEQESIALNNMLEGQEKERSRIGQDLHDRLGGMLSVVKYRFEAFNQSTKIQQVTEGIEQYEQAMTLLDDACEEVRKVSHNISSKTLQRFGLLAALKDLTAHLGNNSLKTNLISQGFEGKQLPDKYKVQIYRMIQELVGNVLKHAEATELAIQLFWRPDHINIGIEDNGKGFDPNNTKAHGLGLEGVKFRAKNLQGEFTLDSQQGEGTSVLINIPLNEIDQENTTATA